MACIDTIENIQPYVILFCQGTAILKHNMLQAEKGLDNNIAEFSWHMPNYG